MKGPEIIVITPAGRIKADNISQALEYKRLYGYPYVKSYPEPDHNRR